MRPPLLLPLVVAMIALASATGPAAGEAACAGTAIARLRAASPEGDATFRRAADPGAFAAWLDCDDAQFGLPTAVHEATHVETSETDAFALVGGGAVARPHRVSTFFPPARIVRQFEADDFTAIYLREGKASSATDALYLLDEFNAYTHDLAAAVDLRTMSRPDESVDHRDGLAAMMAFVAAYAETARAAEPATWDGLQHPDVASAIRILWSRGEGVMASSCGVPRFGTRDKAYLAQVCSAGPHSALAIILGRAPACAAACLAGTPTDDDETSSSNTTAFAEENEDVAPHPRHPFARAAAPRRHPAAIVTARVSANRDAPPR